MKPMLPGLAVAVCLACSPGFAQSVRSLVNGGNTMYEKQKFTDAEVNYRKALEKERDLVQGHFNLGNSLYKQGKYGESAGAFENAYAKAQGKDTKAMALYNRGNALLKEQKYREAVGSYIESLKLNPADQEVKYNLAYALEKLKQQQQQQQQNKNQENKQDKKNQDQQKSDDQQQQTKEQQEKERQEQQNKSREEQQKQEQRPQQGEQEKRMSKADAERILEVLKNSEKDVQKKLRARARVRAKTDKDW